MAVAIPLLLVGWAYQRGLYRARRRAGPGRALRRGEALAFGAGWTVLALMLVLPLHALGRLRFAPHMADHELLTVVAAPLLAAGQPALPWLLALPLAWRRRLGHWIATDGVRRLWQPLLRPGVAWTLHGVVLWPWHAPAMFEATLRSEAIHYVQQISLLMTAGLFWALLLPHRPSAPSREVVVLSQFTTSLHSTLLGALLTLSPTVWYATYADAIDAAGRSALEDQQLASLIMWVPSGLVYMAAALALSATLRRNRNSQLGRAIEGRRCGVVVARVRERPGERFVPA